MRVYLDNAATTPLDKDVFDAMTPYMLEQYGNPSSIHAHGREVRSAIERARKQVAELINAAPSEVFFTSGGTEADNTAIRCTTDTLGITHIITSKLEHHAVLHTVEVMEKKKKARVSYVKTDGKGCIDYADLERLVQEAPGKTLVSLMHGNNEVGNLCDLERIGTICRENNALFHSDTVQTMGHYRHDAQALPVDFMVGSAHKFHGPKGVGFLYINSDVKITPFIHGGAQERNMRGGTENVYGIIGLAKALEISCTQAAEHQEHIAGLKQRMIDKLTASIPGIAFNGMSGNVEESLYTVLNLCLPPTEDNDMLLFNLDINQISASAGSACSSGSSIGSHVLQQLDRDHTRGSARFSFSKYNTAEEIDYVVEKLSDLYAVKA